VSLDANLVPRPSFDTSPHSKILGAIFLVFGLVHMIVVGFLLAMFLFLLVMPFGNPNEDQINLELVIILSIVILFVGVLPIIAGSGLLSTQRWGKNAIAFSSAITLLFLGSVTVVLVWHAKQYALLLYVLPCVILMSYSVWYVWRRRPQANTRLERTPGE
jgi:O-antigen/teichoic acid export membrane protein